MSQAKTSGKQTTHDHKCGGSFCRLQCDSADGWEPCALSENPAERPCALEAEGRELLVPAKWSATWEPEAAKPLLNTPPSCWFPMTRSVHQLKVQGPKTDEGPAESMHTLWGRIGQGQASLSGERAERNAKAVRTPCHIKKTRKHSKR